MNYREWIKRHSPFHPARASANHSELITDSNAFCALRSECDLIFDTSKRLPEPVFRQKAVSFYAFAYDYIANKDSATFLANIAEEFGDSVVNYMTVTPDPVDYYFKRFGFYGLASFETSALIDNYWRVMSRDGNVDSFLFRGGDVGVIWGSSLKWGMFCDRISWELCLMACHSSIEGSTMSTVKVMDAIQLRSYELSLYRNRPPVAEEFSRVLARGYQTLG
jgi:hypothetical protein